MAFVLFGNQIRSDKSPETLAHWGNAPRVCQVCGGGGEEGFFSSSWEQGGEWSGEKKRPCRPRLCIRASVSSTMAQHGPDNTSSPH